MGKRRFEIRRRVGLPRQYFHVMNRGARKVSIFGGDEDRAVFVDLIGDFSEKYDIPIISWALMPNHYHFVPDAEGTPLSRMMHDLDSTYAHLFNRRHGTTGCLFQGPYKTTGIWGPEGLAYVSRYIHLNPVTLGVEPAAYRWSSCRSYLGLEEPPIWLDPGPVLEVVAPDGAHPEEGYLEYLRNAPPRRARPRPIEPGSMEDFQYEYVRFLEERMTERLLTTGVDLGKTQLSTVVCWAALRRDRIPAYVLADFFGLAGQSSVRTIVARFQDRLESTPALAKATQLLTNQRR